MAIEINTSLNNKYQKEDLHHVICPFWNFDFANDARFRQFYETELSALVAAHRSDDVVVDRTSGSGQDGTSKAAFKCDCDPHCVTMLYHHNILRHKACWFRDNVDPSIDIHQILKDWSRLHAAARLDR